MKIAFVSYHYWPPHFGGELLISIERFQSLVERGHEVHVFTSGVSGLPIVEIEGNYIIHRSPVIGRSRISRGLRRIVFQYWVIAELKKLDFDIIHHGGVGALTSRMFWKGIQSINELAMRKGAKTVFVNSLADSESIPLDFGSSKRNLKYLTMRNTDALVSVSPAIYAFAKKKFPQKSHLITNGIRDDIFEVLPTKERETLRKKTGVNPDDIVFSFLGTVTERKGFDILAKAFLSFTQENQKSHLWLIGPSKDSDSQNFVNGDVKIYIEKLKEYEPRVKFFGRINDRKELAKILGATDVFLFPTRREGMPLAPMEAMAAGVPVIISRIEGVTDLANVDGETGFYIEVGDVSGLLEAMRKLANDRGLRERMGKAAHKRAVEHFGWQAHIDKWERLYSDLVNEGKS